MLANTAPVTTQGPLRGQKRRAVRPAQSLRHATQLLRTTTIPTLPVKRTEPDYAQIDRQPLNQLVMGLFRRKMVAAIGSDVPSSGYDAIIELTRKLNAMGGPRVTQMRTVDILASLFPSWLPGAFKVMFAQTMPKFSCQMNAWATALTCQWLMGKCEVNDVEVDGGQMGVAHGVKVERCRYLEQTGCAAVCMNSCKVPTQEFFSNYMGLPVTLTPNYQDFSCQFAFGKTPGPQTTDEAFSSPCFAQCPSSAAMIGRVSLQQLVVAGEGKAVLPSQQQANGSGNGSGACTTRCHRVLPMD